MFVTFQLRNSCCIASVIVSWARAQTFCVWYIYVCVCVCVCVCFKVGKEREKVVPGWSRWSVGKVSDSGFENGSHSALLLPRPPSDCSKADDSAESLCIRFYCSGPLGSQKKRAPLSRSRRQPLQRSRFSLGAGKGRGALVRCSFAAAPAAATAAASFSDSLKQTRWLPLRRGSSCRPNPRFKSAGCLRSKWYLCACAASLGPQKERRRRSDHFLFPGTRPLGERPRAALAQR